jgi:hypothetical protein
MARSSFSTVLSPAGGHPKTNKIDHESPKERKSERRDERKLQLEEATDVLLFVFSSFRAFVIVLMALRGLLMRLSGAP